ncbi:MAG: glycosyltransferase [Planctomycetota bacterium]
MTVTVVTPSYNQAAYLPLCLGSVRSQSLLPMEHLVFDPGSNDGSRDIAEAALGVTLVAEKDDGQADAVGRGFSRARGDIICWLNSDDELADGGVLQRVVDRFNQPDAPDVVYGRGVYIDAEGERQRDAYINTKPESLSERLAHEVGVLQPATFLRRRVVDDIGVPDSGLHFAMDYDYWCRSVLKGHRWAFLDEELALARYYPDNKTAGRRGESYAEACEVAWKHFGFLDSRWAKRWAEFLSEGHDGILRHSGNAEIDPQRVESHTRRILRAFNGGYAPSTSLGEARTQAARSTMKAMDELGVERSAVCRPVEPETSSGKGLVCYTVGERRWGFDSGWLRATMERTAADVERLRGSRRSDTAVIVGNGPSLNDTDLSLLEGVDTFVSNFAFFKPELMRHATYLTVVNNLVAEQGAPRFGMLDGVTKLFPYWLAYCITPDEATVLFKSVGYPEFSTDIIENVSWRHTVSFFNLQLAYGLGYRRVVMIGFDHSYAQASGVAEGDVIEQEGDDANHFDARYFKGKKWHAADTDNMEAMYILAKKAYEADGRTIINATAGGRLELFPRAPLAEALEKRPSSAQVAQDAPRVLVVSSTRLGGMSATGAAMRALFGGWPSDRLAQLHCDTSRKSDTEFTTAQHLITREAANAEGLASAADIRLCKVFLDTASWLRQQDADVIYYRAIDDPAWMTPMVLALSEETGIPIVSHIMDDWATRAIRKMEGEGLTREAELLDAQLRRLFEQSAARLSISAKMSEAFRDRYGTDFVPFQNAVELDAWDVIRPTRSVSDDGVFRIVYSGSLAEDMTLHSFVDVVRATERIRYQGMSAELHVYGASWWKPVFDAHAGKDPSARGIVYHGYAPWKAYMQALKDADLQVLPMNFDASSQAYIQYSLANKSIDAMASGRPILVYGPASAGTVGYALEDGWADVLDRQGVDGLVERINELIGDADRREALGGRARAQAGSAHDASLVRARFADVLQAASGSTRVARPV